MAGGPRPAGSAQLCWAISKARSSLRGTEARHARRAPPPPSQPLHDPDGVRLGCGRLYPSVVPLNDPFKGLEHGKGTEQPASRAEAYALHHALIAAGEPHLAAVPLICFEWHQRPENVLTGHLTWADYRPGDRHGARAAPQDRRDSAAAAIGSGWGPLFPELIEYLDGLERLGVPIVLMKPKRLDKDGIGPARPSQAGESARTHRHFRPSPGRSRLRAGGEVRCRDRDPG
jgi:hypothetical protein